ARERPRPGVDRAHQDVPQLLAGGGDRRHPAVAALRVRPPRLYRRGSPIVDRAIPRIPSPPELPVSQRRAEIAEAIRDHQVVVVAGETGCDKPPQLPKICVELGRATEAMIGHAQPRRLAARTVAERVAAELGTQ